jgi:hypothetical protein
MTVFYLYSGEKVKGRSPIINSMEQYIMCDTSVNAREIDWENRVSKRKQDPKLDTLLQPYLKDRSGVRMLSLPARTWEFEKFVTGTRPDIDWSFTGLEKDPVLFDYMATRTGWASDAGVVVQSHNQTTTEFLLDQERCNPVPFWEVVYFDYMGTWSRAKEEDVRILARNRMCDVFICTVSLSRGSRPTNDRLKAYHESLGETYCSFIDDDTGRHGDPPHYKIGGVPARIVDLFEDGGCRASLMGGLVYDSPSPFNPAYGCSEMVMAFRIEKGI